jgi:hypothetical protein
LGVPIGALSIMLAALVVARRGTRITADRPVEVFGGVVWMFLDVDVRAVAGPGRERMAPRQVS